MLRTPAEPVTDFDKELRKLVKDLTDTMLDAPGAGLAAPQIGVEPAGVHLLRRRASSGTWSTPTSTCPTRWTRRARRAACPSPGLSFPTPRAVRAVAKGFNMYGEPVTLEGTDLMARCFQHETDHLDGVLFIDRMDPEQRKLAMKAIREAEWSGEPP